MKAFFEQTDPVDGFRRNLIRFGNSILKNSIALALSTTTKIFSSKEKMFEYTNISTNPNSYPFRGYAV